jgi:Fe2+ transport system protein FeoA
MVSTTAKAVPLERDGKDQSGQLLRRLSDLPVGESAEVRNIAKQTPHAEQLESYGFVPGAQVIVERTAPHGDPRIYRLDGQLIAVRQKDAQGILLVREKESWNGKPR